MKLRITLIVAALSLPSLVASAQQPAPAQPAPAAKKQKYEVACGADIEKLCKAESQQGKTVECLAAHEKDLSESCTLGFMNGYKAMQICQPDVEKYCKEAQAQGKLGQCLTVDHEKDLSKECKAALLKGGKKQKADEKAAGVAPKEEAKPEAKPAKAAKKTKKK